MTRVRNFIQTFIWVGLLLGLGIGLVWLFGSADGPQTAGQLQPTGVPTVEATVIPSPQLPEVQPTLNSPIATPTLGPHPAGILFESAGELYWQPVDDQGNALTSADHVAIEKSGEERIALLSRSPDGKQVLIARINPNTESEILYVFAPPDGAARALFGGASIGLGTKLFGWHPNNQQIVYWDGERIWLRDIYTDEPTLAAEPQKWADLPYPPLVDGVAFSPDGQQLIVSYTPTGEEGEVWMLNADGSEPRLVFKEDHRIAGIAWSPDGKSIAFVGDGVEVMSSDGGNRRTAGPGFTGGAFPTWSPDSQYVAYTAAESFSEYKIRIIDLTNDTYRNLLSGDDRSDVLPVWSPDGSWILFLGNWSDERGASEVWVASLDGTVLQQLTSDGQPKRSAPLWLPASGGN